LCLAVARESRRQMVRCPLFVWTCATALKWLLCLVGFYATLAYQYRLLHPVVCLVARCEVPEPCSASSSAESNVSHSLQVILPSVGQTGTTSVHVALAEMGYRAYHVEDRTAHMPLMVDGLSSEEIGRSVSRCGVESLSLEPNVDILPRVLEASPKAKVVMTWRAYPTWVKSTQSNGVSKDIQWGYFVYSLIIPYRSLCMGELVDFLTDYSISRVSASGRPFGGDGQSGAGLIFLRWLLPNNYAAPGSNVYERGVFKIEAGEEAYLGHLDEIRQLSRGRLLEFDISRHGYAELAAFLGRPAPAGGPTFPHPRSKDSWTNDVVFHHNPAEMLALLMCCYLSLAVGVIIWHNAVCSLCRCLCRCICGLLPSPKKAQKRARGKAD